MSCEAGTCSESALAATTPCDELGGYECDGLGKCVKRATGAMCSTSSECASGHCVDGVCCATACSGDCMSCNLESSEGTCTPIERGQDPSEDCPVATTCDGTGSCQGALLWARSYGGGGEDAARGLTIDTAGNTLLTGVFRDSIDFGATTLTSAGNGDVFVLKLSPLGEVLWAKRFGGINGDFGEDLVVDSAGHIIVVGRYNDVVDFGSGPHTSKGGTDIFVLKLDEDGKTIWSNSFGGPAKDMALALAVDSTDRIVLAGGFYDSVDFGSGPVQSAGEGDIFVLVLDSSSGAPLWSQQYGGTAADNAEAVAVDAADNVILTASFKETVDFGGGQQVSTGDYDMAVVKLDSTGGFLWQRTYGSASSEEVRGVAVNSAGFIMSAGYSTASLSFGGEPLNNKGGADIVLFALGPDAGHKISHGVPDQYHLNVGSDSAYDVTVDPTDSVLAVGSFMGNVDFGGGALTSQGDKDGFVVKLAPNGQHVWSRNFGGTGKDFALEVDSTSESQVLVSGVFEDTMKLGGDSLVSAGDTDIFVVKLAP